MFEDRYLIPITLIKVDVSSFGEWMGQIFVQYWLSGCVWRAEAAAAAVVNDRIIFEEQLFEQNFVVQPGTSVKFHLDLFKTSTQTLEVGGKAIKNLEASIQIVNQSVLAVLLAVESIHLNIHWFMMKRNRLTAEQGRYTLKELKPQKFTAICPSVAQCSSTSFTYRTVDGSCNNIQHTDWGKSDTALERIIPPKYGDGNIIDHHHDYCYWFGLIGRCQQPEAVGNQRAVAQRSIGVAVVDRSESPVQSEWKVDASLDAVGTVRRSRSHPLAPRQRYVPARKLIGTKTIQLGAIA